MAEQDRLSIGHGEPPIPTIDEKPNTQTQAATENADVTQPVEPPSPDPEYPTPLVFAINLVGLYLAVFCLALDETIITNAIPRITDEFHTLADVGWYASAFFLTQTAVQLPYGKIYSQFDPKWTFLVCLAIFEAGSLICAIAPSSPVLVAGRAVAGVGASGVFTGAMIIIALMSPLEKRLLWQSLLSGIFGVASIIGPLLGGIFTDRLTWRWCFYINLPLGAFTAIVVLIFVKLRSYESPFKTKKLSEVLWSLDPIGFVLYIPSMVSLFLALQWGGTTYSWGDWRIITLFAAFGVLLAGFIVVQLWLGEGATIPPRIATQRTVFSASWYALFLSGSIFVFLYILPIYFQAVKGASALQSGIDSIPLIVANDVAVVLSSAALRKVGYYNPFVFASIFLSCIGSGLLTTLSPDMESAKLIGFLILFGFGSGMGFAQPQNAAQVALPAEDLSTGIAVTLFARSLGTSIFVIAGDNVLNNELYRLLEASPIPGVNAEAVFNAGATGFRSIVPAEAVATVVDIYSRATQKAFQFALILGCVAVIGGASLEWKSMKAKKPTSPEPNQERDVKESQEKASGQALDEKL